VLAGVVLIGAPAMVASLMLIRRYEYAGCRCGVAGYELIVSGLLTMCMYAGVEK
jgi:hypothetical protein